MAAAAITLDEVALPDVAAVRALLQVRGPQISVCAAGSHRTSPRIWGFIVAFDMCK